MLNSEIDTWFSVYSYDLCVQLTLDAKSRHFPLWIWKVQTPLISRFEFSSKSQLLHQVISRLKMNLVTIWSSRQKYYKKKASDSSIIYHLLVLKKKWNSCSNRQLTIIFLLAPVKMKINECFIRIGFVVAFGLYWFRLRWSMKRIP